MEGKNVNAFMGNPKLTEKAKSGGPGIETTEATTLRTEVARLQMGRHG
jgi:hypothetical protein